MGVTCRSAQGRQTRNALDAFRLRTASPCVRATEADVADPLAARFLMAYYGTTAPEASSR